MEDDEKTTSSFSVSAPQPPPPPPLIGRRTSLKPFNLRKRDEINVVDIISLIHGLDFIEFDFNDPIDYSTQDGMETAITILKDCERSSFCKHSCEIALQNCVSYCSLFLFKSNSNCSIYSPSDPHFKEDWEAIDWWLIGEDPVSVQRFAESVRGRLEEMADYKEIEPISFRRLPILPFSKGVLPLRSLCLRFVARLPSKDLSFLKKKLPTELYQVLLKYSSAMFEEGDPEPDENEHTVQPKWKHRQCSLQ